MAKPRWHGSKEGNIIRNKIITNFGETNRLKLDWKDIPQAFWQQNVLLKHSTLSGNLPPHHKIYLLKGRLIILYHFFGSCNQAGLLQHFPSLPWKTQKSESLVNVTLAFSLIAARMSLLPASICRMHLLHLLARSCYHLLLHYLFPVLSAVCFNVSFIPFVMVIRVFPGAVYQGWTLTLSAVLWFNFSIRLSCRKALTYDALLEEHIYSCWISNKVNPLMHFQDLRGRMSQLGLMNFCCYNNPGRSRHRLP